MEQPSNLLSDLTPIAGIAARGPDPWLNTDKTLPFLRAVENHVSGVILKTAVYVGHSR
jgi:hypothetical protein